MCSELLTVYSVYIHIHSIHIYEHSAILFFDSLYKKTSTPFCNRNACPLIINIFIKISRR